MHDARLGMLVLSLQVFVSTASAELATREFASRTATFSEPGENILRAMAHDVAFDTTRDITVRVKPR